MTGVVLVVPAVAQQRVRNARGQEQLLGAIVIAPDREGGHKGAQDAGVGDQADAGSAAAVMTAWCCAVCRSPALFEDTSRTRSPRWKASCSVSGRS